MTHSKYTCIIIDDETHARNLIQHHLIVFDQFELNASFLNPIEAKAYAEKHQIDVLFLDIEMPNLNGIDFIKQLNYSPKIVLTTAYSQFAIDGFALNVVDYLLKPITPERFKIAIDKVLHILDLEREQVNPPAEVYPKNILIKSSHEIIKIPIDDIIYIESLHKYIKIVSASRNHTMLYSITAIEQELPHFFFRCHRSFIINLNHVDKLKGNACFLGTHEIPISKGKKPFLLDKLGLKIG